MILTPKKQIVLVAFAVLLVAVAVWVMWSDRLTDEGNSALKPYTNSTFTFSLSYPEDWVLEMEKDGENIVIFSNPRNLNEEFTVEFAPAAAIDYVLQSMPSGNRRQTVLDGAPATVIEISAGSGTSRMVVLATKGNTLYYITATTARFEEIIETFRFIK